MTMQTFNLSAARIGKYKGAILAHAVPQEVLGKAGRQVKMPKNNSDTYVARRWLPYGATATNQNKSRTVNRPMKLSRLPRAPNCLHSANHNPRAPSSLLTRSLSDQTPHKPPPTATHPPHL